MVGLLHRIGWLFTISLLAACNSTPIRGQPDLLDFIADGSTTRVQVIARLGEPYRHLQTGQVCTYRLSHDEGGRFVSRGLGEASWTGLDASLVLVFDQNAVLQRHSVVAVREP